MLIAGIEAVVVEVVLTAEVVGDGCGVVVIDGAALIFRVEILENEIVEPRIGFVVIFETEHPVFKIVDEITVLFLHLPFIARSVAVVVHEEHGRMVLEELVGIQRETAPVAVVVQPRNPRAEHIALDILVYHLTGIAAATEDGMPVVGDAAAGLHLLHGAGGVRRIDCSTKEGNHLEAEFQRPGTETLLVSYFQISGFRVVQHLVGIPVLAVGEIGLPVAVGENAEGKMAFKMEPAARERHRPVIGKGQTHLRNGSGIDAIGLRATAQEGILELHGLLLGTDGEGSVKPTALNISLLENNLACIIDGNGNIDSIAEAEFASVVDREGAENAATDVTVGLVEGAESILIGIEPQWGSAVRHTALNLNTIRKAVERIPLFYNLLVDTFPSLCHSARRKKGKKCSKDNSLTFHQYLCYAIRFKATKLSIFFETLAYYVILISISDFFCNFATKYPPCKRLIQNE